MNSRLRPKFDFEFEIEIWAQTWVQNPISSLGELELGVEIRAQWILSSSSASKSDFRLVIEILLIVNAVNVAFAILCVPHTINTCLRSNQHCPRVAWRHKPSQHSPRRARFSNVPKVLGMGGSYWTLFISTKSLRFGRTSCNNDFWHPSISRDSPNDAVRW